MHQFFDRSPSEVARDIVGKVLQTEANKIAVIRKALPRTEEDNRPWLKSKPLFRKSPVDVYVSSFRGAHLLFLRTGAVNTCIRIEEIEIEGEVISGPGRVCKRLGISSEQTGDVIFDGTSVKIIWY